jgi:hypothetical protein
VVDGLEGYVRSISLSRVCVPDSGSRAAILSVRRGLSRPPNRSESGAHPDDGKSALPYPGEAILLGSTGPMRVRAVDDKPSDTLVVVSGEGVLDGEFDSPPSPMWRQGSSWRLGLVRGGAQPHQRAGRHIPYVTTRHAGGSQRRISPRALPSRLKVPPARRSPLTGRNQRRSRAASVHAAQTSSIGASMARLISALRASPAAMRWCLIFRCVSGGERCSQSLLLRIVMNRALLAPYLFAAGMTTE